MLIGIQYRQQPAMPTGLCLSKCGTGMDVCVVFVRVESVEQCIESGRRRKTKKEKVTVMWKFVSKDILAISQGLSRAHNFRGGYTWHNRNPIYMYSSSSWRRFLSVLRSRMYIWRPFCFGAQFNAGTKHIHTYYTIHKMEEAYQSRVLGTDIWPNNVIIRYDN